MVHLATIASQLTKRPRVWILRPSPVAAGRPWDYLNRIARSRNVPVDVLVDEERRRLAIPRTELPNEN